MLYDTGFKIALASLAIAMAAGAYFVAPRREGTEGTPRLIKKIGFPLSAALLLYIVSTVAPAIDLFQLSEAHRATYAFGVDVAIVLAIALNFFGLFSVQWIVYWSWRDEAFILHNQAQKARERAERAEVRAEILRDIEPLLEQIETRTTLKTQPTVDVGVDPAKKKADPVQGVAPSSTTTVAEQNPGLAADAETKKSPEEITEAIRACLSSSSRDP